MKYIVQILREADSNSLVLLDELGAGTDPTEGAALGMAVLDFLRKKETDVIATTHHDTLKNYAYLTKGVCNARVEFDEETLKPTFQVSIGLPGKSCAFIIARKLGLAPEVVLHAQSFLSQEKIKADSLIEKIEQDKKLIEKEKDLIEMSKEESIPTVFKVTVLPPVLGPVITKILKSFPKFILMGTTKPFNKGCLAPRRLIKPFLFNFGSTASILSATAARA